MYTKHFGLNMLPFENVSNPVFFFNEGDHARVHTRIKESLQAGRGLMVVTGPIGSGKTTISQMLISEFTHDIKFIWIAEPPADSTQLFLFIAEELGLQPAASERTFVLRDIRSALIKINSEGSKCLVIIDESHLMSDDVINGIRLLNNLEEGAAKLIQILLLGQEEMMETINRTEMEPFKQRIATLEVMGKMNAERIREYISHRIRVAGSRHPLFAETGWEALALALGPENTLRIINSLCDRSLNAAFEGGKTVVDVDDVYNAAEGMGLQKEIFFYKIALKKKDKEGQLRPSRKNDSLKEPEARGEEPISVMKEEKGLTHMAAESGQSASSPASLMERETVSSLSEKDQKGLKIPLLLLPFSIVALISSLYFYCQRSASTDLLSCLNSLVM